MRWLLFAYPRGWRARYGDELLAMLESTDMGPRTVLDVLGSGVMVRLDTVALALEGKTMNRKILIGLGMVLLLIGTATTVWATSELEDGLIEIPGHWWSTLVTLPAIAGLGLLGAALWLRPRA